MDVDHHQSHGRVDAERGRTLDDEDGTRGVSVSSLSLVPPFGGWLPLASLRSSAVDALMRDTRTRVLGPWHPAHACHRVMDDITPKALAEWVNSQPLRTARGRQSQLQQQSEGSAGSSFPILVWLALMAVRSGILSLKTIERCCPSLVALVGAMADKSTRDSPGAAHPANDEGGTASTSQQADGRGTPDQGPPRKRPRLDAKSNRQLDQARPGESELSPDSVVDDDVEFVLPKKRQEYLAARYLPAQPTYESAWDGRGKARGVGALPASMAVAGTLPPPPLPSLPASSRAHLYFPSLYSAQLTALTLQWNDSPATAASHASTSVQPVPNEFKRKPIQPTGTSAPPHGQQQQHTANPAGTPVGSHSRHPSSLDLEMSVRFGSPSAHAAHPPAPRAPSELPSASSVGTGASFRPHIPSASTLYHRPIVVAPTHASIGATFVIPIRDQMEGPTNGTDEDKQDEPRPPPALAPTITPRPRPVKVVSKPRVEPPLPPAPALAPAEDVSMATIPPADQPVLSRKRTLAEAMSTIIGDTLSPSLIAPPTPSPAPTPVLPPSPPPGLEEEDESTEADALVDWLDLPPPPFCFFPWKPKRKARPGRRRPAEAAREKVTWMDTDDDDSSTSSSSGGDATDHSDDLPPRRQPISHPSLRRSSPPDLPLHLCRFLQQQALAPLAHFGRFNSNCSARAPPSAAWPTVGRARRAILEDEVDDTRGKQRGGQPQDDGELAAFDAFAVASSSSSSGAGGLARSSSPVPSTPRLLLSFEDTPGHDELRAFPPSILSFWDRLGCGLKPFNPALAGAFDRKEGGALALAMGGSAAATTMQKHALYLVVPSVSSFISPCYPALETFFRNLAAVYETANLGKHTNLLQHSAPSGMQSQAPHAISPILDISYARPTWLRAPSPHQADQHRLFTPTPSPHGSPKDQLMVDTHEPSPRVNLAPMASPMWNSGAAGRAASPMPCASPHPAPATIATDKSSTAAKKTGFPPLLGIHPPPTGAHRYYSALVWSILQQLCDIVRHREQAGSTSGSGALVPGGAASPGANGGPGSRSAPPALIDIDRYDALLVYLVSDAPESDGGVTHSLPLLSHYLSYLTEPGKLQGEVEALQEQYQHARDITTASPVPMQMNGAPAEPNGSSCGCSPSSSPSGLLEVLVSESDKDCWTSALHMLEHLHLCVHFVPAASLTPLSPSNLRARALQVYTQVCRLSDKVSLFLCDGSSSSVGHSMSANTALAPMLTLPPFPVWFEPLAVLEKSCVTKLPIRWQQASLKESAVKPAAGEYHDGFHSDVHLSSSEVTVVSDVGYALHLAYTYDRRAGALLAAFTDERGAIVHSAIIPAGRHGRSYTAATASASSASSAGSLTSLVSRLLSDHLRPLLLLLPQTLGATRIRLVVVRVDAASTAATAAAAVGTPAAAAAAAATSGTMQEDCTAWEEVGKHWGWSCIGPKTNGPTRSQPSSHGHSSSSSLPSNSARIEDVLLLSFEPCSAPAASESTPRPRPDEKRTKVHDVHQRSFSSAAGASEGAAAADDDGPIDLAMEVEHANAALDATIGNKSWWAARPNASAPSAPPRSVSLHHAPASARLLSAASPSTSEGAPVLASCLFFPSDTPAATQRLTAKQQQQQSLLATPSRSRRFAARVSCHAYYAPPVGGSTSSHAHMHVSPVSPSGSYLHRCLVGVTSQWLSLAGLNLRDGEHAEGGSGVPSGEPIQGLPMHLTVLTRMHAMVDSL